MFVQVVQILSKLATHKRRCFFFILNFISMSISNQWWHQFGKATLPKKNIGFYFYEICFVRSILCIYLFICALSKTNKCLHAMLYVSVMMILHLLYLLLLFSLCVRCVAHSCSHTLDLAQYLLEIK